MQGTGMKLHNDARLTALQGGVTWCAEAERLVIAEGQSRDKQCSNLASCCCHKAKSGRLTVKDNACFECVGYNNAFHGLQPSVAVGGSCQIPSGFRHRCLGIRLLHRLPLRIPHEPLMECLVQYPF